MFRLIKDYRQSLRFYFFSDGKNAFNSVVATGLESFFIFCLRCMTYLRLKLLLISLHCEPLTVRHWLFTVFCFTFVLQMLIRVKIDLLDDDNKFR